MKILTTLTMIGAVAVITPAFASDVQDDQQDIKADTGAIHKDNKALSKDQSELATDRAAKAQDKTTGSYTGQAKDSIAIGADQTKIGEKTTEKKVDKKILEHHQKDLDADKAKSDQ